METTEIEDYVAKIKRDNVPGELDYFYKALGQINCNGFYCDESSLLATAVSNNYYNVIQFISRSTDDCYLEIHEYAILRDRITLMDRESINNASVKETLKMLIKGTEGKIDDGDDKLLKKAVEYDWNNMYNILQEELKYKDRYLTRALNIAAEMNKIDKVKDIYNKNINKDTVHKIEVIGTLIYAMINAILEKHTDVAEYLLSKIIENVVIANKQKVKFDKIFKKDLQDDFDAAKPSKRENNIKNNLQNVHLFLQILPDLCTDLNKNFTKDELKTIASSTYAKNLGGIDKVTKSELCRILVTDAFKFF